MRSEAPIIAIGTEPVTGMQEKIVTEEIRRKRGLIHSSPVKKLVCHSMGLVSRVRPGICCFAHGA
jgi:hypothetical protein